MAGYIGSTSVVASNGAERKKTFSITGTTTSLTGLSYTVSQVHVFHNGVRLVDGTDYTATDGSTITLTNAAENGDEVVVISYATFQTSDTVSASAGGTFLGDVEHTGTLTASGALNTGSILPSTDNASDLGSTSKRFQDLHLSGGVYLGGTGSVNYLDDYEEGTWTPYDESASITLGPATYTKVGRTVTLHLNSFSLSDYTTNNFIRISGMPFSPSGASAVGSLMSCRRDDSTAITPYIPATVSEIRFYVNSNTSGFAEMRHNMFNASTNQTYLSVTYQTA